MASISTAKAVTQLRRASPRGRFLQLRDSGGRYCGASPSAAFHGALHLSRKTVSSHLEHIDAKLGVKTRTEAALFAVRHGLIGLAGDPGTDGKIG